MVGEGERVTVATGPLVVAWVVRLRRLEAEDARKEKKKKRRGEAPLLAMPTLPHPCPALRSAGRGGGPTAVFNLTVKAGNEAAGGVRWPLPAVHGARRPASLRRVPPRLKKEAASLLHLLAPFFLPSQRFLHQTPKEPIRPALSHLQAHTHTHRHTHGEKQVTSSQAKWDAAQLWNRISTSDGSSSTQPGRQLLHVPLPPPSSPCLSCLPPHAADSTRLRERRMCVMASLS